MPEQDSDTRNSFKGPERLALFSPLGRVMRQGAPSELEVSDLKRITAALDSGNHGTAEVYFQLARQTHEDLIRTLFEWCTEYPASMVKFRSAADERACTDRAFRLWSEACHSMEAEVESKRALEVLTQVLEPRRLGPGVSHAFRQAMAAGDAGAMRQFLDLLDSHAESALMAIRDRSNNKATELLRNYWRCGIAGHDALVQYAHSYPAVALELFGQAVAERLIHDSFSNCSFFEGLWMLGESLNPEELAAFLAEHLRAHFSGAERGGAVRVVEEPDRYRLIFDACGSGQEMRRRLQQTSIRIETFPEATPATWNRPGEVPPYCAHCAFNELESIRRFGYPVLVTEFDPDPFKPCGWTIYKDPNLIPEEFFKRLGKKRNQEPIEEPNVAARGNRYA